MPLGRGLGSLIPQKTTPIIPKQAPDKEPAAHAGEGVHFIEIGKIQPNPNQPRKFFGDNDMEGLMNSIKTHGILQPLIVSPRGDKYEIIAGERRYRAAKLGNLTHVPAIVRDVKNHEKMELALVENIQRQNLNPIEEAGGYQRLMDEFGFTQDDVSKKVGKSRPVVANALRLLGLSEEIKKAIMTGKISASAGRVLAGVKDTDKQMDLYKKMLQGLTIRESEARSQLARPAAHSKRAIRDPHLAELEENLREALKTKVDIKKFGKTGKIIIEFYSDEELKNLKNILIK